MVENGMQGKIKDGVLYSAVDESNDGKCSVYIPSAQEDHVGIWSYTFITLDGQVLTGQVDVRHSKRL